MCVLLYYMHYRSVKIGNKKAWETAYTNFVFSSNLNQWITRLMFLIHQCIPQPLFAFGLGWLLGILTLVITDAFM